MSTLRELYDAALAAPDGPQRRAATNALVFAMIERISALEAQIIVAATATPTRRPRRTPRRSDA